MRDFKVGDTIVCILKERPRYFNDDGGMDYLLNAKSKAVLIGVGGDNVTIKNTNPNSGMYTWILKKKDLRLVNDFISEGDDL